METRRITNGYFALLWTLALGLLAPFASGSSSMGGPPGRSDDVKWKDRSKLETKKKQQQPTASVSSETPARRTKFIWSVPPDEERSESNSVSPSLPQKTEAPLVATATEPVQAMASPSTEEPVELSPLSPASQAPLTFSSPIARATAYEQVLTPRQKAILHDRALAFSLSPRDYEHLMSEDERIHVEAQILERKRRLATQD